jgi:hypothetical protein
METRELALPRLGLNKARLRSVIWRRTLASLFVGVLRVPRLSAQAPVLAEVKRATAATYSLPRQIFWLRPGGANPLKRMVGATGIEPVTPAV